MATGEVTSVEGGGHEIRRAFTEEAAPELDLERWGKISQAETERKLFQRELAFPCKARDSVQVQSTGSSVGDGVQIELWH